MKAKVITVTNQKGGTGKTTTSLFLTDGLSSRGKKVLLIDLDQQQNATISMNTNFNPNLTTYQLMTGQAKLKDIIVPVTTNLLVGLAPASLHLASVDSDLANVKHNDMILKKALKPVINQYDYIVLDTPPALNVVILNALNASDEIVVPTQADQYGLKGLNDLVGIVRSIKKTTNPGLTIAGILIDRYDSRTVYAQTAAAEFEKMAKAFKTKVFKSRIREAVAVRESQNANQPIFKYAPRAKVTQDVNKFLDEFLQEK